MKIKKEQRQKEQNRKYKTLIKNSFKDIEKIASIKPSDKISFEKDFVSLENASKYAQKIVDKAAQKGLIHKKNASRKVKRIFGIINLFKERNFSS